MTVITLDRFELGIDLRKGDSVADANRLRDLRNGYVNAGWAIEKRPGSRREAYLSQGSVGMLSFDGYMHTYSAQGNPVHQDGETLKFQNHVILNPDNLQLDIDSIVYNGVFNGAIYVAAKYEDGSIKHHYIEEFADWEAGKAYEEGDKVAGINSSQPGIFYECITAGTSDATEPEWPIVERLPITWEANKEYPIDSLVTPTDGDAGYNATVGGTSGATEPAWNKKDPVIDNDITWDFFSNTDQVEDGTVVWKSITTAIDDVNCPHSASCLILGSKIYAIDDDITRFSATENPLDWTTADDAGYLPTGIRAPSSPTALALGDFQGDLVVFMEDAIQVWAIDPDPQRDSLRQIIGNVGTHYPQSVNKVGDDLYFLSDVGYRSIAQQTYTTNLEDIDVGTPIDPLVRPIIKGIPPLHMASIYFAGGGQYACAIGKRIFVYTFSRTSKVSAWSYYDMPWEVDYMALQGAELYFRAGDDVFLEDDEYYTDEGEKFVVEGLLAYQSFKKPGVMKHVYGCDVVLDGMADIRHRYDARFPDQSTMWIETEGDSRPAPLTPVEVMTTEVAFEFRNETDQPFRLDSISYHYFDLEAI